MGTTQNEYPLEQFLATWRLGDFMPAADGEYLFFVSDIGGQFNLWRSKATAAGCPRPLTFFSHTNIQSVSCSRDGSRLAITADTTERGAYQIYLIDPVTHGWPRAMNTSPLTQHVLSRGAFSPDDGKYLGYSSSAHNPEMFEVYIRNLSSDEVIKVSHPKGRFFFSGWAPDSKQFLLLEAKQNGHQDIWLCTMGAECVRVVGHKERPATAMPLAWTPDARAFYLLTNEDRPYNGIAKYDFDQNTLDYCVTADWDIEAADLSGDGRLLAWTVNEAGRSVLHILDVLDNQHLDVSFPKTGVIRALRFAPSDPKRRLFVMASTYRQNHDVYVIDPSAGSTTQVTQSTLGQIPTDDLVEPEPIEIKSEAGVVPAWLYRPQDVGPHDRIPALIYFHGGPQAQERPSFGYGAFHQYLVHLGAAVLVPNIHGSTGFGSDYQESVRGDWGGIDLADATACANYLWELPWVDRNRVGVWGTSYGGFLALSVATRIPQYWACACSVSGPTNLVTFARSAPTPTRLLISRRSDGSTLTDEDLMLRSPMSHVDDLSCPVLVVQGALDDRVQPSESNQFVQRVREKGGSVEYMVLEQEGHGPFERGEMLRTLDTIARFFSQHLGLGLTT